MEREFLIRELFAEALDRVLRNEDPDPCTAIVGALLRKEEVADQDLELVLAAHRQGPWVVDDPDKLELPRLSRMDSIGRHLSPMATGDSLQNDRVD